MPSHCIRVDKFSVTTESLHSHRIICHFYQPFGSLKQFYEFKKYLSHHNGHLAKEKAFSRLLCFIPNPTDCKKNFPMTPLLFLTKRVFIIGMVLHLESLSSSQSKNSSENFFNNQRHHSGAMARSGKVPILPPPFPAAIAKTSTNFSWLAEIN